MPALAPLHTLLVGGCMPSFGLYPWDAAWQRRAQDAWSLGGSDLPLSQRNCLLRRHFRAADRAPLYQQQAGLGARELVVGRGDALALGLR